MSEPHAWGELKLDPGRREVLVGGVRVELTLTEFEILSLLAANPGFARSRSRIAKKAKERQRSLPS